MLLDQGQDGGRDLVIAYRYDLIHIFLAKIEGMKSRLLYGDTISDGTHFLQTLQLAVLDRVEHAGCSLRLYAIDLDAWVQVLDGEGHT